MTSCFQAIAGILTIYPMGMKQEPFWGGSIQYLTDHFNSGNFKYEVFDHASNRLIYSRAFSSLYQEWQTTSEAKTSRSFYEVTTMHSRKIKIRLVISMQET